MEEKQKNEHSSGSDDKSLQKKYVAARRELN